eukprot:TRINITY_DN3401_c0_g1_i10.p2 TRINITY_DN3401_c0_g1~~TRINITY_DN3401_c0_g1_i10.p2  ORF type:complete len:128 (-),score=0.73 TRINITY_DN3401_c0_g1_i10:36-419(-)
MLLKLVRPRNAFLVVLVIGRPRIHQSVRHVTLALSKTKRAKARVFCAVQEKVQTSLRALVSVRLVCPDTTRILQEHINAILVPLEPINPIKAHEQVVSAGKELTLLLDQNQLRVKIVHMERIVMKLE